MAVIRTVVKLSNPLKPDLAANEAIAIIDTGSINLCLPEYLAKRLSLKELEKRDILMADGSKITCPYSGPVTIQFEDRGCYTGALIFGDEVILGTIPMEDMDLLIHPSSQTVMQNPNTPELPPFLNKN